MLMSLDDCKVKVPEMLIPFTASRKRPARTARVLIRSSDTGQTSMAGTSIAAHHMHYTLSLAHDRTIGSMVLQRVS